MLFHIIHLWYDIEGRVRLPTGPGRVRREQNRDNSHSKRRTFNRSRVSKTVVTRTVTVEPLIARAPPPPPTHAITPAPTLLRTHPRRANELEELTNLGTTMADGATGETSAVRELHAALRDVRGGLARAQKLWKAAEEAADKCEVCLYISLMSFVVRGMYISVIVRGMYVCTFL